MTISSLYRKPWWLIWGKRFFLMALLIGLFVGIFGHPAIRISYSDRGTEPPRLNSATYLSVTGTFTLSAPENDGQLPLVMLVPLDPPLYARLLRYFYHFYHLIFR
jgi:hypothetical protein